jgi:excisionase family DNA binding protein
MQARGEEHASQSGDAVMTVREVSEYFKVAESTIYKLAQEGELPGRKIGGSWRFSRRKLEQWFEQTSTDHRGPAA